MTISACRYPPGTTNWNNKVEHRMFGFITRNWQGRPHTTNQIIAELVAATTTETGLRILAEWDHGACPHQRRITETEIASLPAHRPRLETQPRLRPDDHDGTILSRPLPEVDLAM